MKAAILGLLLQCLGYIGAVAIVSVDNCILSCAFKIFEAFRFQLEYFKYKWKTSFVNQVLY